MSNELISNRRVFFLTLSGISCVTILKYALILSPQFTKSTENKTSNQKENASVIHSYNVFQLQHVVEFFLILSCEGSAIYNTMWLDPKMKREAVIA
jgi:hypothetical protein